MLVPKVTVSPILSTLSFSRVGLNKFRAVLKSHSLRSFLDLFLNVLHRIVKCNLFFLTINLVNKA